MKLKKLIEGLPIQLYKGGKEIEITGLCAHSKRVAPGNLFIVKKGVYEDGSQYVEEAVASGAIAILTNFPNPFLKNIAQLICPDVPSVEGTLASRFYHDPSRSLLMIGITGTNGKTTTAYLIKHILEHSGMPCGLISTIEHCVGPHRFFSELTTPDVITNHKLLREMVNHGCTAAVMEVTSHGLEQKRISGIDFDIGIFTNLSRDHLDYHHTMEKYAAAKARLFSMLSSHHTAFVNHDDAWSQILVEACPAQIVKFGLSSESDLQAKNIELTREATRFTLVHQKKELELSCPLVGSFNVYNCLAAIGVALNQKINSSMIQSALHTFPPVPGRLERVNNPNGCCIFIDFAHTPDALEKVLSTLNQFKLGKLIVVFGCGGDRDRGKRKAMAEAASKHADYSIVTSDNPRSENPVAICDEIVKGFNSHAEFMVEIDRKKAIACALNRAQENDLVLIAGKGHETYQIFSHQTIPFDDKTVALECLRNRICV